MRGDFTDYDIESLLNNILPEGLDKQMRQSIYNMILDKKNYLITNKNKIDADETDIIRRIKETEENL